MLTMEIFASTERRKLPCVSERIGEGACSILSISYNFFSALPTNQKEGKSTDT